jgi:hypothetical protein
MQAIGRGMIASLITKSLASTGHSVQEKAPTSPTATTGKGSAVPEPDVRVQSKLMSIGRGFRHKSISKKVSPVEEHALAESAKKKSSLVLSDNSKSAGAKTTVSSIEKAVEELKVEQILRQSPVRKVGEVGEPANFGTNYIKLKCKNQGVYQYVVHFDPPVDNQMSRIKLLYHASEVTGNVRLFDGHTLFLPILLKDKVTTIKATTKQDTKEFTLRIQLTKILPPQQIPPAVFNIIFKK